jgi:hypothetical protein
MTGTNPYKPPSAEVDAALPTAAAGGRPVALYTTGQVVLATFFGTPLAGSVMMALNNRRLGQAAGPTVLLGAIGEALVVGAGWFLPEQIPSLVFNVVTLIAMYYICNSVQGAVVQAHLAEGGQRGSTWTAVGIGLAPRGSWCSCSLSSSCSSCDLRDARALRRRWIRRVGEGGLPLSGGQSSGFASARVRQRSAFPLRFA